MSLLGLILAFFFIPADAEIGNQKIVDAAPVKSKKEMLSLFNPIHVFVQYKYPRVFLAVSLPFV